MYALSYQQKQTIREAYRYGKHFDLAWTLAAITYVESKGGKYQVSVTGEDYGITQINIYSLCSRLHTPCTLYKRSELATKLIANHRYALKYTVLELQYWQTVHHNSWYRIWGSYNQGHHPNYTYAKRIQKTIKWLKKQKWIYK